MALTPAELAAAYGAGRGDVLSTLSPQVRRFVEGISSMSPEQIAAGYGVEVVAGPEPERRSLRAGDHAHHA